MARWKFETEMNEAKAYPQVEFSEIDYSVVPNNLATNETLIPFR